MRRTRIALAAVGLALLVLATPVAAKGGAGNGVDRGPPEDEPGGGPSEDPGPPDHAEANGHAASDAEDDRAPSPREDPSTRQAAEETDDEGPTSATSSEDDDGAAETRSAPTGSGSPAPTPDGDDADDAQATEATEHEATTRHESPTSATAPHVGADRPASDPARRLVVPTGGSEASPTRANDAGTPAPAVPGPAQFAGSLVVVSLLGFGLVARSRASQEQAAPEEAEEGGEFEDPEPEEDLSARPASPRPGVTGLLTLGRQALDRGDVEDAAEWFRTAARLEPSTQVAHFCLGLCLDELERLDEAEAALAEARRLRPGDVEARYAHAGVLAQRGDTRGALGVLEGLREDMPGLAARLRQDEEWASMRDHPRLLALTGELGVLTADADDLVDADRA